MQHGMSVGVQGPHVGTQGQPGYSSQMPIGIQGASQPMTGYSSQIPIGVPPGSTGIPNPQQGPFMAAVPAHGIPHSAPLVHGMQQSPSMPPQGTTPSMPPQYMYESQPGGAPPGTIPQGYPYAPNAPGGGPNYQQQPGYQQPPPPQQAPQDTPLIEL